MVVWTPRARADLKDIHDYIAEDSPINAKKVIDEILKKAMPLADLPTMGKVVSELNDNQTREISAFSWRIIYHFRNGRVFIVTVIHKRRRITGDDI